MPSTLIHKNLLIIDDEEEICILLSYALKKLGYRISCSLTVKDGKEKIKTNSPDIVLLDLNLPDGSGFSLVPDLKENNCAFLVISAYEDKREKALREGASEFIKKPFNLSQITEALSIINSNGYK